MTGKSLIKQTVAQKESEKKFRLSVLVPRPFSGPLDYVCSQPLAPGTIVQVPLGRKEIMGCVWDADWRDVLPPDFRPARSQKFFDLARLKPILHVIEGAPIVPESLRRFIDWLSAYTLNAPGQVLAITLRVPLSGGMRPGLGWLLTKEPFPATLRLTPSRRAVIEAASSVEPQSTVELSEKSGASSAVIRGLAAQGILKETALKPEISFKKPDPFFHETLLSEDQKRSAQSLCERVKEQKFSVTLLEGVTGSGKTEVYFEALAKALEQQKQILVLLPEIALTAQWMERFSARFGVEPAIWHSDLGVKTRREVWLGAALGDVRVVVGARSALFLPFDNLGLVIVDEEHESTFKQEEGVLYNGRDMAIMRARLVSAPVILVSATPSLETLANVEQGRYQHEILQTRHGGAQFPEISLIDMKKDGPDRGLFLSPLLCESIDHSLNKGEQAMLFLNRRGYAPLTICRACGYRLQCPHCTAWLVEHRARGRMSCHYCEYTQPIPHECPECQAETSLVPVGPGVERIEEEARARFPEAKILSMASDTLSSPAATAEAVRKISEGEVNLIIGTQVVAKGWHFPNLTLVGVVDADLGLGGGDLRAGERTMQLLHQVSGRAGRGEKPGRVMLQSYVGDHPVMQALIDNDIERFMQQEAAQRKPGFWPPYGRLAALIISSAQERLADQISRELALNAPQGEGIQVLGPTPAPIAVLRGQHRRRILLRTRRNIALQPLIRLWLERVKTSRDVKVTVDIDPVSFL
ncbi:primosomal protein N' [Aristophania vespae]|uniref:primosomal protein N' n=1 Tax=Aristophania vespae TaxID=2697033 RepID=UPI002351971B|nr:primosomal protein N' [Aristophania vespae]UMM63880.1 Primosomal protein N' [Aristophania vespae]